MNSSPDSYQQSVSQVPRTVWILGSSDTTLHRGNSQSTILKKVRKAGESHWHLYSSYWSCAVLLAVKHACMQQRGLLLTGTVPQTLAQHCDWTDGGYFAMHRTSRSSLRATMVPFSSSSSYSSNFALSNIFQEATVPLNILVNSTHESPQSWVFVWGEWGRRRLVEVCCYC